MVNGINLLAKDNPRWPIGNVTETIRVPDVGVPAPRGPAAPGTGIGERPATAIAMGDAFRIAAGWLAGLPRRTGARLFAANDAEAGWHGWQVTVLAGGLARRYRDARYDTMRAQLNARAAQADPYDARPGRPAPAIPEAWDDHWDGCPLGGEG